MNRFFRVSALVAVALALAVPAFANIPDPLLSTIPRYVTIAPDGGGSLISFTIDVVGAAGPVNDAVVELIFSAQATELIAWSDPVPGGADIPDSLCSPGRHYTVVAQGASDPNPGRAVFHIAGGGCIVEPDYPGALFDIVTVKADNVLMAQLEVNSPDAVNNDGKMATDPTVLAPVCDAGFLSVGLGDATFFGTYIKTGDPHKCSDVAAPYGGPLYNTDLGDATILGTYIKTGPSAACFAGCP